MNHAEAFLEAMRSNPDDDMPRLVFADWLDDQGDPRGEFIRVQCEIARLEATGEEPIRLRELRRHERELLDDYKAEWAGPLDRWQAFVRFHRGLVDEGSFTAADFVQHAPAILEAVPTLTHLRLRGSQWHIAGLSEVPELAHITGLELPMSFPRRYHLRRLLNSPHLHQLRSLSLANCLLGWNQVLPARTPIFQQVTKLNLEGNGLDRTPIEWLLSSFKPGQLQSLNLARNTQDDWLASRIADHDWHDQLLELDLSGNPIGPTGMQTLAHSPHLKSLTALRLGSCQIGDQGMGYLWKSPGFPNLKSLDLSHNNIADSLNALEQFGWLGGIRDLNLSHNPFDHSQLAKLFEVIDPNVLVRLNLSHTGVGDDSMAAMKTLGFVYPLRRLRELDISFCKLRPEALIQLIKSPYFDSLEKLVLSENYITPEVGNALLESKLIEQLLWLQVNYYRYGGSRRGIGSPWRELKERLGDRVDIPAL